MGIIIQKRNKNKKVSAIKRKKSNINYGKALSVYSNHMRKVNKNMYG